MLELVTGSVTSFWVTQFCNSRILNLILTSLLYTIFHGIMRVKIISL